MVQEIKTKSSAQQTGCPIIDNRDAAQGKNLNVEVSANLCELRVGPRGTRR